MDEITLTQEEAKKLIASLTVARACITEGVEKVNALELQVDELQKKVKLERANCELSEARRQTLLDGEAILIDKLQESNRLNDTLKKFIESVQCDHGCELAPFEMSYHLPGCVVTRRKDLFADKRNDGLQLGESKGLPYPRPISNDEAKRNPVAPGFCCCTCHAGGSGGSSACGCCSYNT